MESNTKTTPPKTLYRYRPLGNSDLVKRELDAILNSYLYAPRFEQMNDPMEAMFELSFDDLYTALLPKEIFETGRKVIKAAAETAKKSGLISMSATHLDYPLWAYYASNFEGMCLEFDTQELAIADLHQHLLVPVVYDSVAPEPVSFGLLAISQPMEVVNKRLMQKRQEWQHEKEWRYLGGKEGRQHYTDLALKRIYLGPRIALKTKKNILYKMKGRPVEIYEGSVHGYDVKFNCIQKGISREECKRTGAGSFDRNLITSNNKELHAVLGESLDHLEQTINGLCSHPNLERIDGVCTSNNETLIRITATYRLKDGCDISRNHWFDAHMKRMP
ncbi:hypothetical protein TU86_06635 [Pseudomonas weihenstephanensis]|uniref:DUF2971 domain-containing protein n=1 Tax=Pseudomonas weihenstephanensis TaxID=1608994 RepID=A0A0J6ISH8_9PSED|nr:hypothetical protein TU86_06635 [Pseudomonas weihenstephanensis]